MSDRISWWVSIGHKKFRYVAWDVDGACFAYAVQPSTMERYWAVTDGIYDYIVYIDIRDACVLCPFDSWNERYLDLKVEADKLLFESLLKL